MRKREEDVSSLSLGNSVVLYGYEIKKLPIGDYLRALSKISGAKEEIAEKAFNGLTLTEALSRINTMKGKELADFLAYFVENAPRAVLAFVCELTGIDAEKIVSDEKVGLLGMLEIIDAFVEVNGLKKCYRLCRKISGRA